MSLAPPRRTSDAPRALQAYLLGATDFEAALAFQRRLVYEVAGDRSTGALLLCEHPPGISIGRQGSLRDVLPDVEELRARRWPVRWVNRGGGCLLHARGQLAVYPVLALDRLGLSLQAYLDELHALILGVLREYEVPGEVRPPAGGVWVGDRRVAHVGVAVRDWVSYFGFALNVDPDLEPFRRVRCDGDERPMTSLQRERRVRTRPAGVRQRLLEAFAARFGFARVSLFHSHPSLSGKVANDAVPSRSR